MIVLWLRWWCWLHSVNCSGVFLWAPWSQTCGYLLCSICSITGTFIYSPHLIKPGIHSTCIALNTHTHTHNSHTIQTLSHRHTHTVSQTLTHIRTQTCTQTHTLSQTHTQKHSHTIYTLTCTLIRAHRHTWHMLTHNHTHTLKAAVTSDPCSHPHHPGRCSSAGIALHAAQNILAKLFNHLLLCI